MTFFTSSLGGSPVLSNLKALLINDDGATLVEYALIVSLIAVACIAVVGALGGQIKSSFNAIGSAVGSA
jgi:pilus assembly protein Flp/PilA